MRLPPFQLERYFAAHEFSAPHLLSASDSESMTVAELLELEPGAAERLLGLRLGYTETAGGPALREAIAAGYGTLDADRVLVHSGGEEAVFTFMNAVLEPGDHVIVHAPCYQSLWQLPVSLGCEVTDWRVRAGDGWALDLDFLRGALRQDTRLVVVNAPHNPTGYAPPPDVWEELVATVDGHGAILLADEAYRGLEYRRDARLTAACDLSSRAVSLGLLSLIHI